MLMLTGKIIPYLTGRFYRPLLVKYLSKERNYRFAGMRLRIHPSVFHPGFFTSTRFLLEQVLRYPLQNRSLLELGAGSGLIAISAAKAGADATASDINPFAVEYLQLNAAANKAGIHIIHSDLFTSIPQQVFDMIVINPPYYFKDPASDRDQAWYCGSDGAYFKGLFSSIGNYTAQNTVILMVLCAGCDIPRISAMANESGFIMDCINTKQTLIEKNFIYRIKPQ